VSLVEFLRTKSSEYELLAAWHAERVPVDHQHFVSYKAILVVGIVLGRSPRRSTWSGGRGRCLLKPPHLTDPRRRRQEHFCPSTPKSGWPI